MLEFSRFLEIKAHVGQEVCMSLISHIFTHVKYANECWEWKGADDGRGYGQIRIDGKLYYVSRIMAWLTYQFDIENPKLEICHHCDNPRCVNPKHLFVGDRASNTADMMKKFRSKGRRPKPNEKDLKFIAFLKHGDETKVAGEKVGYSHSYARTVKSILIPYWEVSGAIPKEGE